VIGDQRTHTLATSQPAPDAPWPRVLGLVNAPIEWGDDGTFAGDGWTFKAAPGWVVREGARRGDYEVVRQQP
jgi:hypothetical protein